ncbi:MAG TPA: DUF3846 domain-containing protein [Arthrobacter sp.]
MIGCPQTTGQDALVIANRLNDLQANEPGVSQGSHRAPGNSRPDNVSNPRKLSTVQTQKDPVMRQLCTALIIPARISHPIRVQQIDNSLTTRQALVEGNVGAITSKDWHVYLNDEADLIPLPLNARAEVLIREAGLHLEETLRGTAVFLGHGNNGDEADAPAHLLRLAERLFDTALAA